MALKMFFCSSVIVSFSCCYSIYLSKLYIIFFCYSDFLFDYFSYKLTSILLKIYSCSSSIVFLLEHSSRYLSIASKNALSCFDFFGISVGVTFLGSSYFFFFYRYVYTVKYGSFLICGGFTFG